MALSLTSYDLRKDGIKTPLHSVFSLGIVLDSSLLYRRNTVLPYNENVIIMSRNSCLTLQIIQEEANRKFPPSQ